MDRPLHQLEQIEILSKALTVLESLVNKPHATCFGDLLREKLMLLKNKMTDVQNRLKFLSDTLNIANQWVQKENDLSRELNQLFQRLEYLENNLSEECLLKIAKDLKENDVDNGLDVESENSSRELSDSETVINTQSKPVIANGAKNVKGGETHPCIKLLTTEEWQKVPSYLRGRMQLDVMTAFINSFNAVLRKKYALLQIPKNKVPRTELPLYLKWKTNDNRETKDEPRSGTITLKPYLKAGDLSCTVAAWWVTCGTDTKRVRIVDFVLERAAQDRERAEWLKIAYFIVMFGSNARVPCHAFITDKDLCTYGEAKLAKRDYTLLQILRHCKRLRESKSGGECYYMLLN